MTDINNKLQKLSTNKLIDLVKNYRQYGYDENIRVYAISILEGRGITEEHLQLTGNHKNYTYEKALDIYSNYKKNSIIAFIFYLASFISIVLIKNHFVLIIYFLFIAIYMVFLIRSFINQSYFYKITRNQNTIESFFWLYFALGTFLYMFMFFYFRKQMRNQMKLIS